MLPKTKAFCTQYLPIVRGRGSLSLHSVVVRQWHQCMRFTQLFVRTYRHCGRLSGCIVRTLLVTGKRVMQECATISIPCHTVQVLPALQLRKTLRIRGRITSNDNTHSRMLSLHHRVIRVSSVYSPSKTFLRDVFQGFHGRDSQACCRQVPCNRNRINIVTVLNGSGSSSGPQGLSLSVHTPKVPRCARTFVFAQHIRPLDVTSKFVPKILCASCTQNRLLNPS